MRAACTASAAGCSHASHGLRSENAQRWKRSGWNWRAIFAENSLPSDCTNGCANSSYARWLNSERVATASNGRSSARRNLFNCAPMSSSRRSRNSTSYSGSPFLPFCSLIAMP